MSESICRECTPPNNVEAEPSNTTQRFSSLQPSPELAFFLLLFFYRAVELYVVVRVLLNVIKPLATNFGFSVCCGSDGKGPRPYFIFPSACSIEMGIVCKTLLKLVKHESNTYHKWNFKDDH